jgi:hypothetical protein
LDIGKAQDKELRSFHSVEGSFMSGKYRIKSPTIALFSENGRHVPRTVPAGAVVEIKSLALDGNRLVEVMWDGRNVMMFSQDIQSRGERVQDQKNAESCQ